MRVSGLRHDAVNDLLRLLNLVIDAFVAAYLKGSEEESDRKAEVQAW